MFGVINFVLFTAFLGLFSNGQVLDLPVLQKSDVKTGVLSETTGKPQRTPTLTQPPTSTPLPTSTMPPEPPRRIEAQLFDVQWEYSGYPYVCDERAVGRLKEYEKTVAEVTKTYRECDRGNSDKITSYASECRCDPNDQVCKKSCSDRSREFAGKLLDECKASAAAVWDEWSRLKAEAHCELRIYDR